MLVAVIQVWPSATADDKPTTTNSEAATKGPKKSKKKKPSKTTANHHGVGPWHAMRQAVLLASVTPAQQEEQEEEKDPIETVIKVARKQLGKPYRWGAVGPNSFDCSGFTMYVWDKVGVQLPHNSGAQNAATKDVPLSEMKPGDLIFSPGHVGMYIGKGKMIHSPHSGRTVEIAPVHSNAYVGGRVDH